MKQAFWVVVAAVAMAGAASAQVGVYAAFSASKLTVSSTGWVSGATFGAYYDAVHLPVVNFGVDARGVIVGGSGASQAKTGLVGPRAVLHLPVVPLHPYVEGLAGAGQVSFGQGPTLSDAMHAGYGAAAGLDFTFFSATGLAGGGRGLHVVLGSARTDDDQHWPGVPAADPVMGTSGKQRGNPSRRAASYSIVATACEGDAFTYR